MGIIMAYSVDDLASFNSLHNWLRQVRQQASENVLKVLVANKADSEDRKVTYEQGKKMAEEFGI